jgi:hypothetical protein
MFSSDDIQGRVGQRPFVPLRLVTSSGETFDIYHPDLVLVGRRELTIGMASVENPRQYERQARVALMHITALEDLPTRASSGGDGKE